MDRRKFLTTATLFAGPAIVRASSLMPLWVPRRLTPLQLHEIQMQVTQWEIPAKSFLIGTDEGIIEIGGNNAATWDAHTRALVCSALGLPKQLLRTRGFYA